MVVVASLNVAKRAGQWISADATIRMNGEAHDTTAGTVGARPYSRFAYGNAVKRAFHQACDEPGRGMPEFFLRHGVELRKVVVLRPEGGDTP